MLIKAILVTTGSYVDAYNRLHEFDRDLILDLAINSNRWLKAGFRIPLFAISGISQDDLRGEAIAFGVTLDGCGLLASLILWKEPEDGMSPGISIAYNAKKLDRICHLSLGRKNPITSARFLPEYPTDDALRPIEPISQPVLPLLHLG